LGAETIATCSAGNADFVKSLGADSVLEYDRRLFEECLKDLTWSSPRTVATRLTVRGESFDAEAR
jgi:NADPH:quinone reductase-like Zn-dependent oxidoreductase